MLNASTRARWFLGLSCSAAALALSPAARAQCFHELPTGCAKSIAAGEGTSPWVIGCGSGDQAAWYWDPSSGAHGAWLETNLTGTQIGAMYMQASDPSYENPDGGPVAAGLPPIPAMNLPMVIASSGAVTLGTPEGEDIDSPNGSVVDRQALSALGGCATSITGAMYPRTGVRYEYPFITGCTEIGVGGYAPYYGEFTYGLPYPTSAPDGWNQFPDGAGTRISVSEDVTTTDVWLLTATGTLWAQKYVSPGVRTDWTEQPAAKTGAAIDVSAGTSADPGSGDPIDSPPWIVDSDHGLEQWNGSGWSVVPGGPPAKKVSIGANGTVWIIDTEGHIWYEDQDSCTCPARACPAKSVWDSVHCDCKPISKYIPCVPPPEGNDTCQ